MDRKISQPTWYYVCNEQEKFDFDNAFLRL